MLKNLNRYINNALGRTSPQITQRANSPRQVLERCPGISEIRSVIDIGASDGRWSQAIQSLPFEAQFVLVEANPIHYPALHAIASELGGAKIVEAAAGEEPGEINFDKGDPLGGVATSLSLTDFNSANFQAKHNLPEEDFISVPVTSIDQLVCDFTLQPPFLIKIDTHGFEPQIIRGMKNTLKNPTILQIEAYNFELIHGSWKFHQLISELEMLGFRVFDIGEMGHRPADQILWQMDIYFITAESPIFRTTSYA